MSKALFWGSTTETKRTILLILLLLLLKEVLSYVNHVLNQIFSFKHKLLFKIFTFAMILQIFSIELIEKLSNLFNFMKL